VIFQDISIKLGSNSIKIVDHLSSDIDKDILRRISDKSGIKSLLISKKDEDAVTLVKSLITKSIKDNLSKCQLIIIVSESKTQRIPPISSLILTDVKTEDTLVLDLDSGCAGYVQALQIVDNFFSNKLFVNAAIITVDTYSKFIEKSNRGVAPIFGDGASINFFENNKKSSIISSNFGTFAADYKSLVSNPKSDKLNMNGAEIFFFVKSKVIPSIKETIDNSKIKITEIDYFIIHQASKLVIDEIKRYFKIPHEKIFFEIQDTGNLVSTSIPFLLHRVKNKVKNNSKLLFSAFGVGLTFSSLLVDYENNYN
jgi:3-oxoacyl-[acyl-carrier-protein] synthase-3